MSDRRLNDILDSGDLLRELPNISWEEVITQRGERIWQHNFSSYDWLNMDVTKFERGKFYAPHYHCKANSMITFLSGSGLIILGDSQRRRKTQIGPYKPKDKHTIPTFTDHGFVTGVDEDTFLVAVLSNPIYDPQTGILDLKYSERDYKRTVKAYARKNGYQLPADM